MTRNSMLSACCATAAFAVSMTIAFDAQAYTNQVFRSTDSGGGLTVGDNSIFGTILNASCYIPDPNLPCDYMRNRADYYVTGSWSDSVALSYAGPPYSDLRTDEGWCHINVGCADGSWADDFEYSTLQAQSNCSVTCGGHGGITEMHIDIGVANANYAP